MKIDSLDQAVLGAVLLIPAILLWILDFLGAGKWLPVIVVLTAIFLMGLVLNTAVPWLGTAVASVSLLVWAWKARHHDVKKKF